HPSQGDLPERRHHARPEPVRERAPAARREEGGGHRTAGWDPARPARHIRLPGEAGPHRGRAPGHPRPDVRHRRRDRGRLVGRRSDRHRGGGQAAGGEHGAGEGARRRDRGVETQRMNPSRLFILRPVATSLLMAAIMLAGAIAYRQLPVSALPQVDYPTIQVLTSYPGASPDVMASSVTAPLERQFGQMPGLNQMMSTSSFGSSVITLQFALDLNIDVAEQEVQAAINAAATYLPRDLPNPPVYSNGAPVRVSDVADVRDDAENVKQAAWMNTVPAVILNIQRQPGANIIGVVDRIEKLLPQLTTALPSSVQVTVLTDRTTTIRASVSDVQFELMLTVALVVMVLFLFLRSLSATIIPSVAVPLSIVGTFGVMYLLGYSLDNLSLMAFTI